MQAMHAMPLVDWPRNDWYYTHNGRRHHFWNNLRGLEAIPQGQMIRDRPVGKDNWRSIQVNRDPGPPLCGSHIWVGRYLYKPNLMWGDGGECVKCRKRLDKLNR